MNWLQRNSKTIIKTAYILPILIAAGVSISHVIAWYGLTNPISWAVYLSIGIEIAALSALAGITTKIGKGAYIPFLIVTFIQFIGNIFYAYQYIDITSVMFTDWVDLVGDLFGRGDMHLHRRILALIGGGFIPMISLSFLHLLVSFTNKEVGSKDDDSWEEEVKDPIDPIPFPATPVEIPLPDKEEVYSRWEDAGLLDNLNEPELDIKKDYILTEDEPNKSPKIDTLEEEIVKSESVLIPEPIVEEVKVEVKEPIIEEVKAETKEPITEEPKKKIQVEDIQEIKEERRFSVNVPNRVKNNGINRVK